MAEPLPRSALRGLDRAERLGWRECSDAWMAMRKLRNQMGKTRPVPDQVSDYVFRNRVPVMQSIEVEAVAHQHMLRLPEQVPDGVKLRFSLLMDDGVARSLEPQGKDRPSRKPGPQLAGSVTMHDDLGKCKVKHWPYALRGLEYP